MTGPRQGLRNTLNLVHSQTKLEFLRWIELTLTSIKLVDQNLSGRDLDPIMSQDNEHHYAQPMHE